MKKSLSFTLLVIAGLVLFSIASCGGSKADTSKADATKLAKVDYEDDYSVYDNYDTYTEEDLKRNISMFP